MSEVNNPENKQPQTIDAYISERREWLQNAVEVLGGDREADPLVVFPEPTPVRQDAEPVTFSDEEEQRLRGAAAEFGMGEIHDILSAADHQVMEGGLAWKIAAEAQISTARESIIFAGSPFRTVDDKEKEFMSSEIVRDNAVGETEYDIARQIAASQDGFEPLEEEIVLPFGYEVAPGFAMKEEATGQLVQIGENNGKAVLVLRVDQDNPEPPFVRPDSAALMGFIADVLSSTEDKDASVGMITTNTYPSRTIDAMRAGIDRPNRQFDVGMAGRQTMADVKREDIAPTPLNQIPGELRKIAEKLGKLESELEEK